MSTPRSAGHRSALVRLLAAALVSLLLGWGGLASTAVADDASPSPMPTGLPSASRTPSAARSGAAEPSEAGTDGARTDDPGDPDPDPWTPSPWPWPDPTPPKPPNLGNVELRVHWKIVGLPATGLTESASFAGHVHCDNDDWPGTYYWVLDVDPGASGGESGTDIPIDWGIPTCWVSVEWINLYESGYVVDGPPIIEPDHFQINHYEDESTIKDLTVTTTVVPVRTAQVSGAVFDDADDDGVRDAGEPGVAGADVTLTGADADGRAVELDTTTGADGGYRFGDLAAGSYRVTFARPPDRHHFSVRDAGSDDDADSDGDPETGVTSAIAVAPGESAAHWDQGLAPDPPAELSVDAALVSQRPAGITRTALAYEITVTNAGQGAGRYDLADRFTFSRSVAVGSVTARNTAPGDIAVDRTFDGAHQPRLVTDQAIPARTTHVYRVDVEATVEAGTTATEADCTLQPGETGTGFRTVVGLDGAASAAPTGTACRPVAVPDTAPAGAPTAAPSGPAAGASEIASPRLAATGGGSIGSAVTGLVLVAAGGAMLLRERRRS